MVTVLLSDAGLLNGAIVCVGIKLRMNFGACFTEVRVKRFCHVALCDHHLRAPFPNNPHLRN